MSDEQQLSVQKVGELFRCGHAFDTECSGIVVLQPVVCYNCDPDAFVAHILKIVEHLGVPIDAHIEEETRRLAFARYHVG